MDQGGIGGMMAVCGGICLAPLITFVAGMYLGKRGLPWNIEISRKEEDYEVDVD